MQAYESKGLSPAVFSQSVQVCRDFARCGASFGGVYGVCLSPECLGLPRGLWVISSTKFPTSNVHQPTDNNPLLPKAESMKPERSTAPTPKAPKAKPPLSESRERRPHNNPKQERGAMGSRCFENRLRCPAEGRALGFGVSEV